MNTKLIEAKIYDIRSQIALLEANAEGEIVSAVGLPLEIAGQIEFQRERIAYLEHIATLSDEAALIEATAILQSWVNTPNAQDRVRLSIIAYALQFDLEGLMITLEGRHA